MRSSVHIAEEKLCMIVKTVLITVVEKVNSTALIVLMIYVLTAQEYLGYNLERVIRVFKIPF